MNGPVDARSCLFCRIAEGLEPAHVVFSSADMVAFLDTRPVFKGHTLVIPRAHIDTLVDLPEALFPPFLGLVQAVAGAVRGAFGADGSFVAMNNVVSQSVPHLHAHVVPRSKGDGLRGFFWPRTRYAGDDEAADYAARLRAALN